MNKVSLTSSMKRIIFTLSAEKLAGYRVSEGCEMVVKGLTVKCI